MSIERKNGDINRTIRRKVLPYIMAAGVTAASIGLAGCIKEVEIPIPTVTIIKEVQVPGPTTTVTTEVFRSTTPQPNGAICENPTDPPPSSFGPGQSTYASPNDIIVGDVDIDGIKMFDDNQYTGLITDNLEANAFVYYPYGGSKITISDPIKRTAEIEKQEQIMSLSGKKPDVINYFGGPGQPTQR